MTLHELGLNADTSFRLFIGILIIVVHLKVANKSSLAQFTSIDFIGNFILGGIIYNHTISMLNYIVILLATIMMIAFLNYISENFLPARRLVRDDVVPIIEHGQFRLDSVGQPDAKFDLIDFMSVARSRGSSPSKTLSSHTSKPMVRSRLSKRAMDTSTTCWSKAARSSAIGSNASVTANSGCVMNWPRPELNPSTRSSWSNSTVDTSSISSQQTEAA